MTKKVKPPAKSAATFTPPHAPGVSVDEVVLPGTDKPKRCAICNVERSEHARLLAAGELHHRFSERGELVHESPGKPQASPRSDLALRMALIDAGLLTYEQIARAEARLHEVPPAERRRSGGDRPDRPAEGP